MKAIRVLGRSIRDSFKSVFRNFSLSIASVVCTTITLILVAVAIIIAFNIKEVTTKLEKELTIVVYLKEDISQEQIETLKDIFKNYENVDEVTFKSNDESKLEMQNSSPTFNTTLSYLKTNPLLNSFMIKVKEAKYLKETTAKILENPNVESARYGKEMVEKLLRVFDIIEKLAVGMVLSLILVTTFLISNTIKLTIFSRRNEIEIMRLVGTSNTAIKLPFIFEGLIIGVIGSLIPIIFTIYGYIILYEESNGQFSPIIPLVKPLNFILYVALILLFIGAVVGMFSSFKAARKYLKI